MLIGQDPSADRASAARPAPLTAPGMKRMKILRYKSGENTRSSGCWFVLYGNKHESSTVKLDIKPQNTMNQIKRSLSLILCLSCGEPKKWKTGKQLALVSSISTSNHNFV